MTRTRATVSPHSYEQRGTPMSEIDERNELREVEEAVLRSRISARDFAGGCWKVVGQFSDSLRAHGLPEESLRICRMT